jgi:hypothetical protein
MTTSRPVLVVAALILASAGSLRGQQAPAPPPLRIAASSFASVEVHLNSRPIGGEWYEEDAALTGPARIAIRYGQPHARGRRVEGGLIPRDTVWRFGANEATALHTDLDLMLGDSASGGLRVPRGDYSLFVLSSADGYRLIVNRRTGWWGTDYSAADDLGRIRMAERRMAEPRESLTLYLVPESARPAQGYAELRGTLRIEWGTTELTLPWTVVR